VQVHEQLEEGQLVHVTTRNKGECPIDVDESIDSSVAYLPEVLEKGVVVRLGRLLQNAQPVLELLGREALVQHCSGCMSTHLDQALTLHQHDSVALDA